MENPGVGESNGSSEQSPKIRSSEKIQKQQNLGEIQQFGHHHWKEREKFFRKYHKCFRQKFLEHGEPIMAETPQKKTHKKNSRWHRMRHAKIVVRGVTSA